MPEAGTYVAVDRGYFRHEGLDVQLTQRSLHRVCGELEQTDSWIAELTATLRDLDTHGARAILP